MGSRGRGRALWGAVAALALSGCWLQPDQGPEGQRYNPLERAITSANVGDLRQAWQVETGLGGQPVVKGGRVFLGATRGAGDAGAVTNAAAFSLGTGETVWAREVAAGWAPPIPALGPTMVADELWLGRGVTAGAGFATEYVRLDPDDGSPLGTVTEDGFATVPAVTGTILADVSVLGFPPEAPWRLTVRDAATTDVVWTAALPAGAAEPFTAGAPGPLVAHGHVYVATDEGLLAFDASGCGAPTCDPAWTVPHRADLWGDLTLRAATGDGHVVVTRRYSGVEGSTGAAFTRTALTAYTSTGEDGWSVPPVEAGSNEVLATAVAGDVLYVAGREEGDGPEPARHHLRAYATATGAPLWSADLGASGPATRAAIAVGGDVAYVGVDGAVRAFARSGCGATACSPLAELPVPGTPGALAIAGGHLLVTSGPAGTPASTLTAFAPTDPG